MMFALMKQMAIKFCLLAVMEV